MVFCKKSLPEGRDFFFTFVTKLEQKYEHGVRKHQRKFY